MSKMSDKLSEFGVHVEFTFNNLWCYKYQFPGQDLISVSNTDKEKAANRFFIDYLKSLHYSIRHLYEKKMFKELKELISVMRNFNEPNINKTIDILLNSGMKIPDNVR